MTSPIPNLFKVPELKEKLLFTFLCLVIYRIGAHIATPGVNVDALADFMNTRGTGTLFGLYDLFSGGGLRRATVFALGIMPYISASIVFQLAGPVFPIIEKMQRDEEGKKTLTQWTRYVTVLLCIFQAYGFAVFTESLPANGSGLSIGAKKLNKIIPYSIRCAAATELGCARNRTSLRQPACVTLGWLTSEIFGAKNRATNTSPAESERPPRRLPSAVGSFSAAGEPS